MSCKLVYGEEKTFTYEVLSVTSFACYATYPLCDVRVESMGFPL